MKMIIVRCLILKFFGYFWVGDILVAAFLNFAGEILGMKYVAIIF